MLKTIELWCKHMLRVWGLVHQWHSQAWTDGGATMRSCPLQSPDKTCSNSLSGGTMLLHHLHHIILICNYSYYSFNSAQSTLKPTEYYMDALSWISREKEGGRDQGKELEVLASHSPELYSFILFHQNCFQILSQKGRFSTFSRKHARPQTHSKSTLSVVHTLCRLSQHSVNLPPL